MLLVINTVLPSTVAAQAIISAGSCYKIRLKKTNSPLQVMSDGSVQQQSQSNQANQLWKADDAGNGRYRFTIQDGTNRVVTTPGGNEGDVMVMSPPNGAINQQWRAERNNSDGSYRLLTAGNVTWDVQNYGIYTLVQLWGNSGEGFFDYRTFLFESASCSTGGGGGSNPPPVAGDMTNITGYVGINTSNTGGAKADGEVFRLAVKGKILAEEIRVRSGWADFVFSPHYKLPSLQTVDAHIKAYKHLPGMPTAQDIQANGVEVGVSQALLLQKIEELTLYVLQQKRQIDALERKVVRIATKR